MPGFFDIKFSKVAQKTADVKFSAVLRCTMRKYYSPGLLTFRINVYVHSTWCLINGSKIWIWRLILWVENKDRHNYERKYNVQILVLIPYWFYSYVLVLVLKPRFLRCHGTGSDTLILVPTSRASVQGFQGVISICLTLVLVLFNFGSISATNQVKPKTFVPEPKLTGT